jgi:serine protease Do
MFSRPLLVALREELISLADLVVKANARVDIVGGKLRESSGSAWLYADRLWVTNHHVIADARGKVILTNGTQRIAGEVVGKDADTDLAVIRVDTSVEANPLVLKTESAKLGELCFAIGAPLGEFADTMSMGIISGLNRRLPQSGGMVLEDVLQTDAAINHGNSGGPLVDINGFVLGVNTAGIDAANSIGFAVPTQTVAEVVPELIEHGSIARATIGVKVEIRRVGMSVVNELLVLEIHDERSPLRPGDILHAIDGRPLSRRADLMRALHRNVINREVSVLLQRDGVRKEFVITPLGRMK